MSNPIYAYEVYVVKDRLGYVVIDRSGQPVTRHYSLQRSATVGADQYLKFASERAEAARLCDGFCL